jgi:hypothetical protein
MDGKRKKETKNKIKKLATIDPTIEQYALSSMTGA